MAYVETGYRLSEVRSRILSDHERLRGSMVRVEALTSRALSRFDPEAPELCRAVVELCQQLRRHMELELDVLRPALLGADPWGEERAHRLEQDHVFQLALVDLLEQRARDANEVPHALALLTEGLLTRLREDMQCEERILLSDTLLKDDLVVLPEPD